MRSGLRQVIRSQEVFVDLLEIGSVSMIWHMLDEPWQGEQ